MFKPLHVFLAGWIVVTLAIVLTTVLNVTAQSDDPNCQTAQCRRNVAAARAATDKYHDLNVAIADGYFQVSPCIEVQPFGGMGFHYLNLARLLDFEARPTEPDILVYMPDADGVRQLVALEYQVPYIGQGPPTLFDLPMQGPEDRGGGPAYERHAWVWKRNPNGMFQPFNPKLSCPSE